MGLYTKLGNLNYPTNLARMRKIQTREPDRVARAACGDGGMRLREGIGEGKPLVICESCPLSRWPCMPCLCVAVMVAGKSSRRPCSWKHAESYDVEESNPQNTRSKPLQESLGASPHVGWQDLQMPRIMEDATASENPSNGLEKGMKV